MLGLFCVTHHSFHRCRKSASASSGGIISGIMAPSMTSSGSGQGMLGLSCVTHHSFQIAANAAGWGLGVGVGVGVMVGLGVAVGRGVAVGTGVAVGRGVAVGTEVAVGMGVGTEVAVGMGVGTGVAVGGTAVGGTDVAVGSSPLHAANMVRAIRNGMKTRTLGLASQDCTIQLPLRSAIPRGAGLKTCGVGSDPTLTNPSWLCQCI